MFLLRAVSLRELATNQYHREVDKLKHVALYLRISQAQGRQDKIEDQEKWGREYAARTWPDVPVVTYTDNDISAAGDDHRPGYELLRKAIGAGQVAGLWAKEQSRLERKEVEWFGFAAFAADNGLYTVHTLHEGVVDMRGVVAGIKAVINAHEVRQLRQRVNDRLQVQAQDGRPPGSRPFGYVHSLDDAGGKTYAIVEDQAETIRWAAQAVLAGRSLSSVTKELQARGLHGPHRVKVRDAAGNVVTDGNGQPVTRYGALTAHSVRRMVTSPTVAGKRVYRRRIIGDGNWPAILTEDTWRSCVAKLTGSRTVDRDDGGTYPIDTTLRRSTGRKYVLTGGLAVCGVCGAPLIGSLKQIHGRTVKPYLLCHPRTNPPGRACVGIMLPETQEFVVNSLFAELDKPEFLDAIAEDTQAERREQIVDALGAIDGQRDELARMWATPGELTSAEWKSARRELADREHALRVELAAKPPVPARVDIDTARDSWPDMDLGEQREFLRLFIDKVTVNRATPGRKGFDPGRVSIVWTMGSTTL
jgi:DNA invertase Pin-like site-specific DNA recombinase